METWDYERKSLKKIWVNILKVIMRYVTLKGRFTIIPGHHFNLLNHFRHGLFISFSFFLLSSMEVSVYAHLKNTRAPILHEGPILLIMKHVKTLLLASSIKGKEKIPSVVSGSSGLDISVAEEEEWNEDDEEGTPSPMATSSKKRKKGNPKGKQEAKFLILNE